MNKQQALEQAEKLKAELERLEAIIAAPEKVGGYPENGTSYTLINTGGSVLSEVWEDHVTDKYRFAMGNVYLNPEHAAIVSKINKAYAELIGDWWPDWGLEEGSSKRFSTICFNVHEENAVSYAVSYPAGEKLVFPYYDVRVGELINRFKPEEWAIYFGMGR